MKDVKSLLDKEDITYLTEQENILKSLQAPFIDVVNKVSDINLAPFEPKGKYHHKNHFFTEALRNKQRLFDEGLKAIEEVAREFVSMIRWYLEDKYDVSLHLSLGESFDFLSLSLDTVYKLVEKELNGMTFEEKSIDMVKQGVRQMYPSSAGKTVEIKQGFDWDFYHLSLSSESRLKTLLKGVVLFETGKKELTKRMNFILEYKWTEGELELEKALRFKIFKNGKLHLTFKDKEDAQAFVQYFAQ